MKDKSKEVIAKKEIKKEKIKMEAFINDKEQKIVILTKEDKYSCIIKQNKDKKYAVNEESFGVSIITRKNLTAKENEEIQELKKDYESKGFTVLVVRSTKWMNRIENLYVKEQSI